jgi:hypothetical protein
VVAHPAAGVARVGAAGPRQLGYQTFAVRLWELRP